MKSAFNYFWVTFLVNEGFLEGLKELIAIFFFVEYEVSSGMLFFFFSGEKIVKQSIGCI